MIRFEQVSKWYGQVSALLDVDFEIGPGVTGLIGQNGAGKSTLMSLCSGLLSPSQGQVTVCGGTPTRPETRANIGLCPDLDSFYEKLSAVRFVSWLLRIQGFRRADARVRAEQVLVRVGLQDAMHRAVGGYSKGMRQRVKLAQAIAHDPSVVLLDEPLTGLDPIARRAIFDLVREMGADGRTVLVSSHVLHELQEVVDRVLFVHRGRLLAEGPVDGLRDLLDDRPRRFALRSPEPRRLAARLLEVPAVDEVRVGEGQVEVAMSGTAGVFEAWTEIGSLGDPPVEEVVPMDSSLEAVFGYLAEGGR